MIMNWSWTSVRIHVQFDTDTEEYKKIYRNVYILKLLYTHTYLLALSGRSKVISVTRNTFSTQIQISNTINQQTEPEVLGEMTDFRAGAGREHDEFRTSCARNQRHT